MGIIKQLELLEAVIKIKIMILFKISFFLYHYNGVSMMILSGQI